MRNLKLEIAYDGTNFHGWQRQPNGITIQGEIEKCLITMHNKEITLHGAGRTDAGVHALGMIAHFTTDKSISCNAFYKALNSMLPASIRILSVSEVEDAFHSRFSAKGKTYIYSFFTGPILLPQHRHYTVHIKGKLNFRNMQECLSMLIGTHDFGCFETSGSRDENFASKKGSTRTITEAVLESSNDHYHHFRISGDGFLRHMVRNIVGTTLEVGLSRRSIEGFKRAFDSKLRSEGGATAPPNGLTLQKIYY